MNRTRHEPFPWERFALLALSAIALGVLASVLQHNGLLDWMPRWMLR